jgi:hypothetical protein
MTPHVRLRVRRRSNVGVAGDGRRKGLFMEARPPHPLMGNDCGGRSASLGAPAPERGVGWIGGFGIGDQRSAGVRGAPVAFAGMSRRAPWR